jgi:hypothetical protein
MLVERDCEGPDTKSKDLKSGGWKSLPWAFSSANVTWKTLFVVTCLAFVDATNDTFCAAMADHAKTQHWIRMHLNMESIKTSFAVVKVFLLRSFVARSIVPDAYRVHAVFE